MKKIIVAIVSILIIGISCISCTPTVQPINDFRDITNENVVPEPLNHIYKFTFEGHNYIMFQCGYSDYKMGGVVHDPNCSCHK